MGVTKKSPPLTIELMILLMSFQNSIWKNYSLLTFSPLFEGVQLFCYLFCIKLFLCTPLYLLSLSSPPPCLSRFHPRPPLTPHPPTHTLSCHRVELLLGKESLESTLGSFQMKSIVKRQDFLTMPRSLCGDHFRVVNIMLQVCYLCRQQNPLCYLLSLDLALGI